MGRLASIALAELETKASGRRYLFPLPQVARAAGGPLAEAGIDIARPIDLIEYLVEFTQEVVMISGVVEIRTHDKISIFPL